MKQIPLTQGKVAIVDDEDYELVSQWKWNVKRSRARWHARTSIRTGHQRKNTYLHRLLMQPASNLDVDHIDGDGLNNQRANLRVCTRSENCRNQRIKKSNTSGFKGVTFNKQSQLWQAQIRSGQAAASNRYLGLFASAEEAARAYDAVALTQHGEFARINFPREA
jgi:hypothetical protein